MYAAQMSWMPKNEQPFPGTWQAIFLAVANGPCAQLYGDNCIKGYIYF